MIENTYNIFFACNLFACDTYITMKQTKFDEVYTGVTAKIFYQLKE